MSKPVLDAKALHDEAAAYTWLEARVWPDGPVCPHCGGVDRIGKMKGKSTRIGVYKCYQCRKPFTVKVGTIFEDSHVPMHYWVQAIYLMCSSKKGVSTNQLHRTLGVTLKTAWFMSHRIREAMRSTDAKLIGGPGEIVEVDETIFGKQEGAPKNASFKGSNFHNVVMTLVERGRSARSFHVEGTRVAEIAPVVRLNIARESRTMTDDRPAYRGIGEEFASHETVNHSEDEYVRDDVYTNTVEGMNGTFTAIALGSA
jgi:transposase-like protein